MVFRDQETADRARLEALERENAELRKERDELLAERAAHPDKTLDKAREAREREVDVANKRRAARERADLLTIAPLERWIVAWNLRRWFHISVLIAGLIVMWGTPPFASESSGAGFYALLVGGPVAGTAILAYLLYSLLSLRSLRRGLPFELDPKGWAQLVHHRSFWIREDWRDLVVTVEGGDSAEVSSALRRFCATTEKAFYRPESDSDDRRIRWQARGFEARGSANRVVAYLLLVACRHDLAPIRGIRRVKLLVSDQELIVSAPSD